MSERIIHAAIDLPQGSDEWLKVRLGRPTASEFSHFLKQDFTLSKAQTVRGYLHKKVAERHQGHCLPGFSARAVENGEELEAEARGSFEWETGLETAEVGFVEFGRTGCSPDGLIGEYEGLELKAPEAHTQVGYIDGGEVPQTYIHQVHGSLYVTGRDCWHFYSYRRGFPSFHRIVERDDKINSKIHAALQEVFGMFDEIAAKLEPQK